MNRRRFLAVAGLGAATATTGCIGLTGGGSGETGGTTTGGSTDGGSMDGEGSSPNAVGNHPATVDLASQPTLGDVGGHVVVAFEDPSCPRCKAFEERTVPQIREKLVETGKAAFVFRNYPVIYPWGKPATQALESTFARDEGAFWSLLAHYFENQSSFSTENVLDETATFLDENTALDGAAVAEDARDEAHGDAVQADLDAGRNADVGGTTPTVLLFRDGQYVTRASGSVSYDLIATALGE